MFVLTLFASAQAKLCSSNWMTCGLVSRHRQTLSMQPYRQRWLLGEQLRPLLVNLGLKPMSSRMTWLSFRIDFRSWYAFRLLENDADA